MSSTWLILSRFGTWIERQIWIWIKSYQNERRGGGIEYSGAFHGRTKSICDWKCVPTLSKTSGRRPAAADPPTADPADSGRCCAGCRWCWWCWPWRFSMERPVGSSRRENDEVQRDGGATTAAAIGCSSGKRPTWQSWQSFRPRAANSCSAHANHFRPVQMAPAEILEPKLRGPPGPAWLTDHAFHHLPLIGLILSQWVYFWRQQSSLTHSHTDGADLAKTKKYGQCFTWRLLALNRGKKKENKENKNQIRCSQSTVKVNPLRNGYEGGLIDDSCSLMEFLFFLNDCLLDSAEMKWKKETNKKAPKGYTANTNTSGFTHALTLSRRHWRTWFLYSSTCCSGEPMSFTWNAFRKVAVAFAAGFFECFVFCSQRWRHRSHS